MTAAQNWARADARRRWEDSKERHSLSKSSSANRFRVNFHTAKPITPSNTIPPHTERPMIVDLLTPLSFELLPLL